MSGCIYEIVNTCTGKRYIGSTANWKRRIYMHRFLLERGRHHSRHLQSAWALEGSSVFQFNRMVICEPSDLLFYEQAAIDALQPEYNILPTAGSSAGVKCSPETKAKISAANKGRKFSTEAIAKRSATMTGRKLSPEHASKLLGNKHALGLKHTDEWKRLNSIRNTGLKRPKTAEQRAKLSAALKGIPHSPERRAKQAAAQRGLKRRPYNIKRNQ